MAYVREKPIIRRSDRHEFRFYPQSGQIRIVPLTVQYGQVVAAQKGGLTLRRKDLQRGGVDALEVLVALLNEWRVRRGQLGNPTEAQVEAMQHEAKGRRHIFQQVIDPA